MIFLLFTVIMTGCGVEGYVQAASQNTDKEQNSELQQAINSAEDEKIKNLISDYFTEMYAETVLNYQSYSEKGSIPEQLKKYLAKRTTNEGDNNIEIGLNYPRFVGLNGTTLIDYSLLTQTEKKEKPQIEAVFIEKNNDRVLYFVKLNLKAKCIPDEVFNKNYELNESTQTYKKISEPDSDDVDTVKVQARFDVELIKENNDFKILRARESTFKEGARNRLFRYNNDFISKIPYLNLDKKEDNQTYINKEDYETYEKEKEIITAFFDNILSLDNERRNLLGGKWEEGSESFGRLCNIIEINKDKNKKELFSIDGDYKDKFPKNALILEGNYDTLQVEEGLNVSLHPAYSEKKKWYIVTFTAICNNSSFAHNQSFSFDYYIKLTGNDSNLRIESIKLNNVTAEK